MSFDWTEEEIERELLACETAIQAYNDGLDSRMPEEDADAWLWHAWRVTVRDNAYDVLCISYPSALREIRRLQAEVEHLKNAIERARKEPE